jgi:hypothetical protein
MLDLRSHQQRRGTSDGLHHGACRDGVRDDGAVVGVELEWVHQRNPFAVARVCSVCIHFAAHAAALTSRW